MSVSDNNLDFWLKYKYNVIFRGKHGTGKTATVIEAFNRAGLKWKYFSAATMDAFTDFVGVPKEKIGDDGIAYLDFVKPIDFAKDEVEAIFFDEYNRGSKRVRNSVMELIQFKSINGKKFNNLKVVWAAINPEDESEGKYDVEALDPAQLDRFHIVVDMPYKPDVKYFNGKYGSSISEAAVNWWNEQPEEVKVLVSPRRLDYALEIYQNGGDIHFVLPKQCNINKLKLELKTGPTVKTLHEIFEKKNEAKARHFLSAENNFAAAMEHIVKDQRYVEYFTQFFSEEKTISSMHGHQNIKNHVFANPEQFVSTLEQLATTKSSKLSNQAAELLNNLKRKAVLERAYSSGDFSSLPAAGISEDDFTNIAVQITNYADVGTTQGRTAVYNQIVRAFTPVTKKDNIEAVLNVLATLISKTQISTLQKNMPFLVPMMNNVLSIAKAANIVISEGLSSRLLLYKSSGVEHVG